MIPASPSPDTKTAPGQATAGTAAGGAGGGLTPAAQAFLASRGLSASILGLLPVAFGTDRGRECVFFGQIVDGDKAGYKARPLDEKLFWQKPGTAQRLWNLDQVKGAETVLITEGELDACALVECGFSAKQVVSIFGGAKGDDEANLKQAQEALEQLAGVKRIYLVHDGDRVGLALRRTLAKVLGAARCWFLEWPEGIKDANEMLVKEGPEALRELVENALPWPVDGLYRIGEIPQPPPLELWDAGWPEWNGGVKLAPTHLSVMTGHGGDGKTRFGAQMWWQIARANSIRVAVCTMETLAKPGYLKYLRQFIHRKPQHRMTPDDLRFADGLIDDHYRFIQHPERKPGLKWLLDVAEAAVVREGCRALKIDPWNKLERTRDGRQSETDYIGEVLDELMLFATDLNCHVQVVAHPAKSDATTRRKDGTLRPPELENIAGSKAWETKPDQGFVMYRPQKWAAGGQRLTDCEFYVRKTRFDELGYPRCFHMRLDLATECYVSTEYEGGYRSMGGAA